MYANCGYNSTKYSVPWANLHLHGYVLTRAVEQMLQCEIVSLVNQTDKQQENAPKNLSSERPYPMIDEDK